MDFLLINGKAIKPPKEITVSPEVLDKSERTADGTLVVDIIGTKEKWTRIGSICPPRI